MRQWLKAGKRELNDVKLASPAVRSYFMNFTNLLLVDNVVYRRWTVSDTLTRNLIVVPQYLVMNVLHACHDDSGHVGESKTLMNLSFIGLV